MPARVSGLLRSDQKTAGDAIGGIPRTASGRRSGSSMKKWLYDRPWIWIVVFFGVVFASSIALIIIAQVNRPTVLPH